MPLIVHATSFMLASAAGAAPFDRNPNIHDVPWEYPTVQLAVQVSSDGDTIRLAAGTYSENVNVVSKGVRFTTVGGPVTLTAASDAAIFTVEDTWEGSTVEFVGINFSGDFPGAPQDLRAIDSNWANIVLAGCSFEDFAPGCGAGQESRSGGAIDVTGGSISIYQCEFVDCQASADGGAIDSTFASIEIDESQFDRCEAGDDGGAIRLWGSTAQLTQLGFSLNNADDKGGHIYILGGDTTISRSEFMWGDAGVGGAAWCGGFMGDSSEVSATNCRFGENEGFELGTDVWHHDDFSGPSTMTWMFCGTQECSGVNYPIYANDFKESCYDCAADPNEDGTTDVHDLIELLRYWGDNDPFTDLNWDDTTDSIDLVQLLEAWGGCEPYEVK